MSTIGAGDTHPEIVCEPTRDQLHYTQPDRTHVPSEEKIMSGSINRRRFIQSTSVSAAAAGFWLTGGVTETSAQEPANRLNVAIIGAGGRGSANVGGVAGENIVALCDTDDRQAAGVYKRYPNVPKFKDFRVMLEKQKDIQAVVVSTPDHCHFHASMTAIRMGKHCYTEKPLTHSVWEARQLKEAAAKHRVATQMGNQGTSGNDLRAGVEAIQAGAIGDVREIHLWTNRPIWPQNVNRPTAEQAVPAGLDWDVWLGPAPHRPYHADYVPFKWRGWWDFGTGALGDMGCHTMNLPYMALRLGAPSSVEADVQGAVHAETAPMGCTVTFEFPARGSMPPCKLYWYERRTPAADKLAILGNRKPGNSGCLMVGAKGTLYTPDDYGARWVLLPEANFANFQRPNATLPRSPGHHQEWIRACKGGAAAMSNFVDYAAGLTETILLGNVAIRVGRKFSWDSAALRATDCPQAAQYVRREYRKGWTI